MKNLKLKRVYDEISDDDGFRILVDRLWPRGVKKSDANMTTRKMLGAFKEDENLRREFISHISKSRFDQ